MRIVEMLSQYCFDKIYTILRNSDKLTIQTATKDYS